MGDAVNTGFSTDNKLQDIHFHVCEHCLNVWFHKRSLIKQRIAEHTCEKCGAGPYLFGYNTRREAEEIKNLLRKEHENA